MKLREALANKDYSLFEKSSWPSFYNYYDYSLFEKSNRPSFYNYYDTLSDLLYNGYSIRSEHYDAVEASGRIEKYAIREWLCTDTHAGLYLYLVDGEQICISYQPGRKSYPEWKFFSVEAKMKLRQLFDECMPTFQEEDRTPLVDKDLLNLLIHKDLFDYEVTNEQMGISAIVNYKTHIGLIRNNLDKPHIFSSIETFESVMKDHENFMQMLLDNSEHESHSRNLIETQPIYEDMKKLVETLKEIQS